MLVCTVYRGIKEFSTQRLYQFDSIVVHIDPSIGRKREKKEREREKQI